MPKINPNDYHKYNIREKYSDADTELLKENYHVVQYLKDNFGISEHMLEAHPCGGDESIFIKFKGESFWLFEFDEETFYEPDRWFNHVQYRLIKIYEQMEEMITK